MTRKTKVFQIGLGDIGLAITRILAERENYEITGAADANPALIGGDLGRVAGLPGDRETTIHGSITDLLADAQADIAILTTSSYMEQITPQVMELVDSGLAVVSTSEELVYPWRAQHDLARQIDQAARDQGVAVLSTGVNPGFLMDFLPTIAARISRRVNAVEVERVQDAGIRREAFQRKVGAGLTVTQFDEKVAAGGFGHAGLIASVELLAAGLGWQLDSATETIEPVVAEKPLQTEFFTIAPGQAAGVYQTGQGLVDSQEVITLRFRAAVGETNPHDLIRIDSLPPLELIFPGGIHGDTATGAIVVNAIPLVLQSPPGLRTMADLWPAHVGALKNRQE